MRSQQDIIPLFSKWKNKFRYELNSYANKKWHNFSPRQKEYYRNHVYKTKVGLLSPKIQNLFNKDSLNKSDFRTLFYFVYGNKRIRRYDKSIQLIKDLYTSHYRQPFPNDPGAYLEFGKLVNNVRYRQNGRHEYDDIATLSSRKNDPYWDKDNEWEIPQNNNIFLIIISL